MRIGILGAGIGGLSSAYFLKDAFKDVTVYEAGDTVGGLARSFKWHGFDCDIGPHRLYTEDAEILKQLQALVPMRKLRRKSSIFIQNRWIRDPVNIIDLLAKFFPKKSAGIVFSYLFRKRRPPDNFDNVVLSRFGSGLNTLFFKPYSEKLFGIPAHEISASWARTKLRVGGFKDLIRKKTKLYFNYFFYPERGGYGAICDSIYEHVSHLVQLNMRVTSIVPLSDKGGFRCEFACGDKVITKEFDLLLTSLPLPVMGEMLGIRLDLHMRPTRFVYLLLNKARASENHWFYFADGDFVINRVSEYKNFKTDGLPPDKTVVCCEVTQLERFSQARLIEELSIAGILKESDVEDILIFDVNNAYPIYGLNYDEQIGRAKEFFSRYPTLFHIGRNANFSHKDADEIFFDTQLLAKSICSKYA